MTDKPELSQLVAQAGISKSYACEILGDRIPSRRVAIHIFRTTGWKHPRIADLTDDQIALLEQVDPFQPKEARAA